MRSACASLCLLAACVPASGFVPVPSAGFTGKTTTITTATAAAASGPTRPQQHQQQRSASTSVPLRMAAAAGGDGGDGSSGKKATPWEAFTTDMAKKFAVAATVAAVALSAPGDALAARSGGRMGGRSFSSPSVSAECYPCTTSRVHVSCCSSLVALASQQTHDLHLDFTDGTYIQQYSYTAVLLLFERVASRGILQSVRIMSETTPVPLGVQLRCPLATATAADQRYLIFSLVAQPRRHRIARVVLTTDFCTQRRQVHAPASRPVDCSKWPSTLLLSSWPPVVAV